MVNLHPIIGFVFFLSSCIFCSKIGFIVTNLSINTPKIIQSFRNNTCYVYAMVTCNRIRYGLRVQSLLYIGTCIYSFGMGWGCTFKQI